MIHLPVVLDILRYVHWGKMSDVSSNSAVHGDIVAHSPMYTVAKPNCMNTNRQSTTTPIHLIVVANA